MNIDQLLQDSLFQDRTKFDIKAPASDLLVLHARRSATASLIDRNIEKSKRLAGRKVSMHLAPFISELCPACNGKRIVDVGRPDVQCPVCYRRNGHALGIVLVGMNSNKRNSYAKSEGGQND